MAAGFLTVSLGACFRKRPILAVAAVMVCLWTVALLLLVLSAKGRGDLSDLIPPARRAAAESNAVPLLLRAADAVTSHREIDRLWYGMTNKAGADRDVVAQLLAKEAEPLRLFRAAMQRPECVWTNPSPPFDEVFSYSTNWAAVFRLILVENETLVAERDPAAAVSAILDGMGFANRVGDCGAGLSGNLAAATLKSLASRSLKRLAHKPGTPDAALREAIARLGSLSFGPTAISNVIKEELARSVAETAVLLRSPSPIDRFQFDTNATTHQLAPAARAVLQSVGRPYANSPAALYRPPTNFPRLRLASAMLRGNILGEAVGDSTAEQLTRIVERNCSYNNVVKSTRVILALLLYERANGRLPETLDELVPKFIDAVPEDGFDGKPLRYSKDLRLVWSVGTDLKDDGGLLRVPGNSKGGDQLFRLE